MVDYTFHVPNEEYISELYIDLKDIWRDRNTFIEKMREMLVGENDIEFPANTSYKIRTMHTYILSSVVNEKAARYSHLPTLQVIPEQTEDITEARRKSSSLEQALEIAQYEMERHGDGDVWSRVIMDAIIIDEGVERIERAPAAFWPELTAFKTAKAKGEDDPPFAHIFETDDAEEKYKTLKGIPIRSVYVPLENYLPVLEGSVAVETIEIETRTLRSLKRNKLFDSDAVAAISGSSTGTSLKEKVTILHYTNQKVHAYFGMAASTSRTNDENITTEFPDGMPVLLHAYEHNLGQTLYNSVAGRFGGWKGGSNKVEGISKALMDLNQKADEIMSQVVTNVRGRYWPTNIQYVDPDRRGYQAGSPPKPKSVPEGTDMVMFINEKIEPLFKTEHDQAVPWLIDQIHDQISQLAGSGSLFGGRQPGVETGYQQSLQISQAEHLDEKIEQHVSWGAVMRGTMILKHIRRMGSVYANYIDTDDAGDKVNLRVKVSKGDLTPMPRLSAAVRKPRPVDFSAAIRSARDVTDMRNGMGPLFSDDKAREEILGVTQPEQEKRKIAVEREQRKLEESGVITSEIQKKLAMILAQQSAPDVGPSDAANADPALIAALSSGGEPAGPDTSGGGIPLNSGQPVGQAQPEASNGTEIAGAQASPLGAQ